MVFAFADILMCGAGEWETSRMKTVFKRVVSFAVCTCVEDDFLVAAGHTHYVQPGTVGWAQFAAVCDFGNSSRMRALTTLLALATTATVFAVPRPPISNFIPSQVAMRREFGASLQSTTSYLVGTWAGFPHLTVPSCPRSGLN